MVAGDWTSDAALRLGWKTILFHPLNSLYFFLPDHRVQATALPGLSG